MANDTDTRLMVPTVHLNGTSRAELMAQLAEAYSALDRARGALARATPHGRDYYVQDGDAIGRARADHAGRCKRVADVQAEILAIGEAIQ
jgi:hypothetical protein